jgi:RyR domain
MPTIVVAGDLVRDHHLVQLPEDPDYDPVYMQNPVLTPSVKLGGAWYLEELVRLSCKDVDHLKVCGARRNAESSSEGGFHVEESYSVWSPHNRTIDNEEEQVWRINRFLGYHSPPEESQPLEIEGDTSSPNVLVLDDVGRGFRHKQALWPQALHEGGSPQSIVIKAHAQLLEGPLWKKLLRDHADQITVVTSVAALRAYPRQATISKALSWDQTIEEIAVEFECGPSAQDLGRCRRVIVHFDDAGAAIFTRCPLKWDEESASGLATSGESNARLLEGVRFERFLYHPVELEGSWKSSLPGDSFGASAIMTAAVVRHELRPHDYPIIVAMKRALVAMRANHEIGGGSGGFSVRAPNKRIEQIFHSLDDNDSKERTGLEPYCAAFPHEFLSDPVMKEQPATKSDLLQDLTGAGYEYVAAKATEIVMRGWEKPLELAPKAKYGNYITVDRDEIQRINEVRQMIERYRNNAAQQEPLAIAVFGPPGSGKSFAIRELAKEVFEHKIRQFNLTQIREIEQLHEKFHQVRTASVLGEIPLVFWDEFDTGKLTWLKYFLAPIQDGEFETSSGTYPFGKSIFIFAGGTSHSFEHFNRERRGQEEQEFRDVKGPDFVSRLSGYIDIKGPNPIKRDSDELDSSDRSMSKRHSKDPDPRNDVAHLIRRAVLLRSLLERFQPNVIDERSKEPRISPGLIGAFLRVKKYVHGARSLEAVVRMSTLNDGHLGPSGLPAKPLLQLHVSPDFMSLIEPGEVVAPVIEALAETLHDAWYQEHKKQNWRCGPQRNEEAREHPLMRPFKDLPEPEKERNRLTARVTHAKLLDVGFRIVRQSNDMGDNRNGQGYVSRHEYNKQLPHLREIEHDIWLRNHLLKGFDRAPRTNEDLLLHRDVTVFEKVPQEDQAYDDVIAGSIYERLEREGYALIRV